MLARLRDESRLVFSGTPSTITSMLRPRRVWPYSVMVRLESDIPGTALASTVARLSEPWRSSSSWACSMTVDWRVAETRSLLVREAVISICSMSSGSLRACVAGTAASLAGTTMKVCSSLACAFRPLSLSNWRNASSGVKRPFSAGAWRPAPRSPAKRICTEDCCARALIAWPSGAAGRSTSSFSWPWADTARSRLLASNEGRRWRLRRENARLDFLCRLAFPG